MKTHCLYAKEVFFEGNVGMELMARQFINHYGDLEILDDGNRFRFKLNKFDGKGLTKKAVKACEIFRFSLWRNGLEVLVG